MGEQFPALGSMDIDTTNAPPLNEIDVFPIQEEFNFLSGWGDEPTTSMIYSGSSSPAQIIQAEDTEEGHCSGPPKSPKDNVRTARDHFFYKNAYRQADGLFHCPWEGESSCNHKPDRKKYVYE